MKHSQTEPTDRFDDLYGRIWLALHRRDDPDLSQHEREVLHHVAPGTASLTWLAEHLGLPKSTTSVLVKDLERRGFVTRTRDRRDERRLIIALTSKGRRRVDADTVLDPARLQAAFARLPRAERNALLSGMTALAESAESVDGR